jgi:hypothetical protein
MFMLATTIFGYTLSILWISIIVFFWVLIALAPAFIAKNKGYSFWLFFLLSLFFWWIMLFVALFMHDKNVTPAAPAQA